MKKYLLFLLFFINLNASDINLNASDINLNASDINLNASDINLNASDINLNASDINMPGIVLDAIKNAECLTENGVCNPNVIRINEDNNINIAKLNGLKPVGHIIKCLSVNECSDTANKLIKIGVINIDLGAYQINYKYHKDIEIPNFFEEEIERTLTNDILIKLVNKFGYSWETIARYHHYDVLNNIKNEIYQKKLYAFINTNK